MRGSARDVASSVSRFNTLNTPNQTERPCILSDKGGNWETLVLSLCFPPSLLRQGRRVCGMERRAVVGCRMRVLGDAGGSMEPQTTTAQAKSAVDARMTSTLRRAAHGTCHCAPRAIDEVLHRTGARGGAAWFSAARIGGSGP